METLTTYGNLLWVPSKPVRVAVASTSPLQTRLLPGTQLFFASVPVAFHRHPGNT